MSGGTLGTSVECPGGHSARGDTFHSHTGTVLRTFQYVHMRNIIIVTKRRGFAVPHPGRTTIKVLAMALQSTLAQAGFVTPTLIRKSI